MHDLLAADRDRAAVPGPRRIDVRDRFRHGAHRPWRGAGAAQRSVRALSATSGRVLRSRIVRTADLAARLHGRAGREREHRCAEDADPAFADRARPHREHAVHQRAPDVRAVRARAAGRRDRILRRPTLSPHQPSHPALDGLGHRHRRRGRLGSARGQGLRRTGLRVDTLRRGRRREPAPQSQGRLDQRTVHLARATGRRMLACRGHLRRDAAGHHHAHGSGLVHVGDHVDDGHADVAEAADHGAGRHAARHRRGAGSVRHHRHAGRARRWHGQGRALARRYRAARHRAQLSGTGAAGAQRH